MTREGDHLLELEILGQTYQVRVRGTEEWAKKVGMQVDAAMREIQRETRLSDTTKIAILAALNLADRYLILKEAQHDLVSTLRETTLDVGSVLTDALR